MQSRSVTVTRPNQISLVATFAEDCGPCRNFKVNQLPALRAEASRRGIRLVEKSVPHRSGEFPPDIPTSHARHISWFPSFIIYDSRSWDEATKNPKTYPLTGIVFNGELGPNGRIVEAQRSLPITAEYIAQWASSNSGGSTAPQKQASNPYADNCSRLQYVNPSSLRYLPK